METIAVAISLIDLTEELRAFTYNGVSPGFRQKALSLVQRGNSKPRGTRYEAQVILEQFETIFKTLRQDDNTEQLRQGVPYQLDFEQVRKALGGIQATVAKLLRILSAQEDFNATKGAPAIADRQSRRRSGRNREQSLRDRANALQNSIVKAQGAFVIPNPSRDHATNTILTESTTMTQPTTEQGQWAGLIRSSNDVDAIASNRTASHASQSSESLSEVTNGKLYFEALNGVTDQKKGGERRSTLEPVCKPHIQGIFRKLSMAWWSEQSPEYWRRHDDYQRKRSEHTCDWILEDSSYLQWLGSESGSLLCLQGKPGSGKSTLISRIIDSLRETESESSRLACIYLAGGYRMSVADMLLDLLEQLCMASDSVPQSLSGLAHAPSPPDSASRALLEAMLEYYHHVQQSRKVVIIIDAWDEHSTTSLQDFVDVLDILLRETPWRILISSRTGNVRANYCIRLSERILELSGDIMTMANTIIQSHKDAPAYSILAKDRNMHDWFSRSSNDPPVSHTDGPFFWVDLKIQLVLPKPSLYETTQILDDRSGEVTALAKLALRELSEQTTPLREMAQMSLLWLSESRRPITLQALRDALAFAAQLKHEATPTMESSNHVPTEEGMRRCWGTLANVDPTTQIVALANDQLRPVILETWKNTTILSLGEICIRYLTLKDFYDLDVSTPMAMRRTCKRYQFLDYSGHTWILHAYNLGSRFQGVQQENDLRDTITVLIRSPESLRLALAISNFDHTKPYTTEQWMRAQGSPDLLPLLLASELGLDDALALILDNAGPDLESQLCLKNEIGQTALHLAAQNGHKESVRLLLEAGALPLTLDTQNKSSLHYAREGNHNEVFDLLFGRTCELWMQRRRGEPGHFLSEVPGREDLLRHFGRLHNVNRQKDSTRAVCDAIDSGNIALVLAFICRGCDINGISDGLPILHHAINLTPTNRLLVREILEAGADPSAQEQLVLHRSPLHFAASLGNIELTRLLLEYGTDVDTQDSAGRTALYYALQATPSGDAAMAELLLQHRIDLRASDTVNGRQIIHEAALRGSARFIDVLLHHGANVRAQTRRGETPLDMARARAPLDDEIVRRFKKAERSVLRLQHLRSTTSISSKSATMSASSGSSSPSASSSPTVSISSATIVLPRRSASVVSKP